MKTITVLLLLEIFSAVSSFDFRNPNINGVEYDDTKSPVEVTVDENNSGGKITVLRILEADKKPDGEILSIGGTRLAPEIVEESGQYVFKVEQLDYENLVKDKIVPSFLFSISDSKTSKNVTVNIKNLDDESPTLEAVTIRCEMMEETVIDVMNSQCLFEVGDPDGWLNSMSFEVTYQDSLDIFEMKYGTIPPDSLQNTSVYLVPRIGETFDYETRQSYVVTIDAKDAAGHSIDQKLYTVVTVTDKPPVWTLFPNVTHVEEEKEASFQVIAIDADQNYPHEVNYYLTSSSSSVRIDKDTGMISVGKIDGDLVRSVSLTVTAHYNDPNSYALTQDQIQLLIDDIDDNLPKIEKNQDIFNISLPKNISKFFIYSIVVNDNDATEENSAYDIDLKTTTGVISGITLFPSRGYSRTEVQLIINTMQFNRDHPNLNTFGMELWVTGVKNSSNRDTWPIVVYLENENSSGENIGANWVVGMVLTCAIIFHII